MVNGAHAATPLFVTLLLVDLATSCSLSTRFRRSSGDADVIVFTSNAFAILGLRSLYFAIAGLMVMFEYISSA